MRPSLSVILEDASRLEQSVQIEDARKDIGPLLKFEANLNEPIHRWYKFKESFSHRLVSFLLHKHFPVSSQFAFLDPFCGVGTSLLAAETAALELGAHRIATRGIEVNPYIHFVARTKLGWDKYDPGFLVRAASIATNGLRIPTQPIRPLLSTLQNPRFISPRDLDALLQLREKVQIVSKGRPEQRPLLLGLAAGAERMLNLRKDGRALRFLPREEPLSVHKEVLNRWYQIAEDLQLGRERTTVDHDILLGDGRRADRLLGRRRFNVILFSPPYLNNIDYTEVYKVELWLLRFIRSSQEMTAQRRRTFRSHPSCIFPNYQDADPDEAIRILGAPFRRLLHYASHLERWRYRLFSEYFADMLRTLRGCRRILAEDGRIFIVVGNSLHGTSEYPIPVATDLWIAKLARAAGLRVEHLWIGRDFSRKRLSSPLLRESVIIIRKG